MRTQRLAGYNRATAQNYMHRCVDVQNYMQLSDQCNYHSVFCCDLPDPIGWGPTGGRPAVGGWAADGQRAAAGKATGQMTHSDGALISTTNKY